MNEMRDGARRHFHYRTHFFYYLLQNFQFFSIHILEINDVYTYVLKYLSNIIIMNYVYVSEYGYWHWIIWFLF